MKNARRKVYAVLFGLFPIGFLLMLVEQTLFENGTLNAKDLQGVAGSEKGTPFDYSTNVWVWDGTILIFMAFGVITAVAGMIMLIESKARLPREE